MVCVWYGRVVLARLLACGALGLLCYVRMMGRVRYDCVGGVLSSGGGGGSSGRGGAFISVWNN